MAPLYAGSLTSLDILRQQNYCTSSVLGSKRTHEEANPHPVRNPRALHDLNNAQPWQFDQKRQKLEKHKKPCIVASEICDINEGDRLAPHVSEYSQRRAAACTPSSSLNPLLSLSHPRYGLSETLVKNFASLGINSIYPWQSSCFLGRGLLTGEKNLVYTAPTGGGKSLVADVLILKRVIEDPTKKAIVVLPYVALVQEKLKWLQKAVEGVQKTFDTASQSSPQQPSLRKANDHRSVRVVGFFGGSKTRATWSDVDVAVCTIEKVRSALLMVLLVLKRSDVVYRQIRW